MIKNYLFVVYSAVESKPLFRKRSLQPLLKKIKKKLSNRDLEQNLL